MKTASIVLILSNLRTNKTGFLGAMRLGELLASISCKIRKKELKKNNNAFRLGWKVCSEIVLLVYVIPVGTNHRLLNSPV